jgi:CheY-like chemotaxis protein/anti-sigma regulatory factor (Ser/Thr protein kinase)
MALRNARRVLDLINQILDVARLEAGRTPLRARPLDLGTFVEGIAQPFREPAARKAMHFGVELPTRPVEVFADPLQLEKVVANLLSNALKFTPEGGAVRVTVSAEGDAAHVVVRDSGPGIPAADVPHVFDRFYQVNEAAQTQLGTGIGLALAKEVVDLHGGALTVASEEGFGSTFTVTLPLGRAHLAPEQIVEDEPWTPGVPRPALPAEPGGDGLATEDQSEIRNPESEIDQTTVLVVEDHPEVRAYIRRHLEAGSAGSPAFRVIEAADGEAGLALARERLPDLVVSDVMMPKLDGLGLCRALKANPETDFIPVLLLTAKAAPEDRLDGLREYADDYLTKPFDVAELRARIANLIAMRTRLRERFRQESAGEREGAPAPVRLSAPEAMTSADDAFLERIAEVVEAHLGDETFSVASLAEAVGMSRGHLHRQLKALAGQTPSDLIRTMRLERAAHLLTGRVGTVSEIAYAVGFKSVGHFSDSFVDAHGCRPSAYAEREQPADGRSE